MMCGFCFGNRDVGLVACVARHGLGVVACWKVRGVVGIVGLIHRVGDWTPGRRSTS